MLKSGPKICLTPPFPFSLMTERTEGQDRPTPTAAQRWMAGRTKAKLQSRWKAPESPRELWPEGGSSRGSFDKAALESRLAASLEAAGVDTRAVAAFRRLRVNPRNHEIEHPHAGPREHPRAHTHVREGRPCLSLAPVPHGLREVFRLLEGWPVDGGLWLVESTGHSEPIGLQPNPAFLERLDDYCLRLGVPRGSELWCRCSANLAGWVRYAFWQPGAVQPGDSQ